MYTKIIIIKGLIICSLYGSITNIIESLYFSTFGFQMGAAERIYVHKVLKHFRFFFDKIHYASKMEAEMIRSLPKIAEIVLTFVTYAHPEQKSG